MRMIDADSLESKLPAHSNDSDHVMTRNFAVESFRALIKAEPTVTPSPVYAKGILLDRAVRYDLQNAFPKALLNLRLELIAYPARNTTAIVFAETAGKAKTTALATENFWGSDFLDVEVHRQPGADQFYTPGKTEMDWCDPQDRINMVKYFGFTCLEHVEECHFCPAKEFCEDRRDV